MGLGDMIGERVGALLSIVTCRSASFESSAAQVSSLFNDELPRACDMIAKLMQRGLLFNTEYKLNATYILYRCYAGDISGLLQQALHAEGDDCVKALASDMIAGRFAELSSFTPKQYIDRHCSASEAVAMSPSLAQQLPGAHVGVLKAATAAPLRPVEQRKLISNISSWNEYQVENEMQEIDFVELAGLNPDIAVAVLRVSGKFDGLDGGEGSSSSASNLLSALADSDLSLNHLACVASSLEQGSLPIAPLSGFVCQKLSQVVSLVDPSSHRRLVNLTFAFLDRVVGAEPLAVLLVLSEVEDFCTHFSSNERASHLYARLAVFRNLG